MSGDLDELHGAEASVQRGPDGLDDAGVLHWLALGVAHAVVLPAGPPGGGAVPCVRRVDLDDQMRNIRVVRQGVKDSPQLGDVVGADGLPRRVVAAGLVHPSPAGRPGVAQARAVGADRQRSTLHVSPSWCFRTLSFRTFWFRSRPSEGAGRQGYRRTKLQADKGAGPGEYESPGPA